MSLHYDGSDDDDDAYNVFTGNCTTIKSCKILQ